MRCQIPKIREVVEQKRFTQELANLIKNPIRADEFVEAVKTALAYDPQPKEATCIREAPPLWFIPCSIDPSIAIFYRFDQDSVFLESIIETK